MAVKAGYNGNATLAGGTKPNVFAWTLEEIGDELDGTTFANGSNSNTIIGIVRRRGSIAAYWDATDAIDVGDSGLLSLVPGSGSVNTITMQATIASLTTEAAHDGIITGSMAFVVNGGVTKN